MATKFQLMVTYHTITCCWKECGITFAVNDAWVEHRRQDHSDFYCPNGHRQGFYGPSQQQQKIDELAAETARLQRAHDFEHERRVRAENDAMDLANSNRALKGVATKLRKRAAAGVCAFCHRTFQQVARHVKTKHPHAANA